MALLGFLFASCGGRKAPARDDAAAVAVETHDAAPAPGRADAGAAVPTPTAPPAITAAQVHAECEAFLARWVDAQNTHDWDAYRAMYEPTHFRGVRRVHGKGATRFDHDGWLRDRKRMVLGKATVAAEVDGIETWLDPASKLKREIASIRFTQRWRGGGYADHGTKVLQVWRAGDGKLQIVYEDTLDSDWDGVSTTKDVEEREDVSFPVELSRDDLSCTELTCTWSEFGNSYDVVFAPTDGGRLKIVALDASRWEGCSC